MFFGLDAISQYKQTPLLMFSVTWKFFIEEGIKIILGFRRNICVSEFLFVKSL